MTVTSASRAKIMTLAEYFAECATAASVSRKTYKAMKRGFLCLFCVRVFLDLLTYACCARFRLFSTRLSDWRRRTYPK